MAVAFDAFATGDGTGASITVSITLGGTANLLIAFVMIDAPSNFNPSATWNGVSMGALVNEVFTGRYLAWFKLASPDTGTHDLVVSGLPGGGQERACGISFSGVDTTTPTDAAQSSSLSGASDPVTLTNSSATGDMVVGCAVNNGSSAPTVDGTNDDPAMTTPTGGSVAQANMSSLVTYQAGQATVTTSWNNVAGSESAFAININASGGGGGGGSPAFRMSLLGVGR